MAREVNRIDYYDDGEAETSVKDRLFRLLAFLLEDASDLPSQETMQIKVVPNRDLSNSVSVEWKVTNDEYSSATLDWVSDGEVVMKEITMPDGSTQYAFREEDANEVIGEWLKTHKGWVKGDYGSWHNVADDAYDILYLRAESIASNIAIAKEDKGFALPNGGDCGAEETALAVLTLFGRDDNDYLRRTGVIALGPSLAKAFGFDASEGRDVKFLGWHQVHAAKTQWQEACDHEVAVFGVKAFGDWDIVLFADNMYQILNSTVFAPTVFVPESATETAKRKRGRPKKADGAKEKGGKE